MSARANFEFFYIFIYMFIQTNWRLSLNNYDIES